MVDSERSHHDEDDERLHYIDQTKIDDDGDSSNSVRTENVNGRTSPRTTAAGWRRRGA